MIWNLLVVGTLGLAAVDVDVQLLNGGGLSGKITSLTAETLKLQTGDGEKSISRKDLQTVIVAEPLKPAPRKEGFLRIQLTDGSRILAAAYTVSQGVAAIELPSGQTIQAPAKSIRSVLFKDQDEQLRKQWRTISEDLAEGDVIVTRKSARVTEKINGEEIVKTITALHQLDGFFGDVSSRIVQFTFAGDVIDVPREKVEGLFYFHPPPNSAPQTVCRLYDRFGSIWNVRSVQLSGDRIEAIAASNLKFSLPLEEIQKLDFSAGNLIFLSDLTPQTAKWTPFLGSSTNSKSLSRLFPPRFNQSHEGGPLLLANVPYEKGLALHSRTLLEYHLPQGLRSFMARIGIDSRASKSSHVILTITGDGETLFNKTISGKDKPFDIELDINNVRRFSILVDYGERSDIADHLNLCNARMIK